MDLESTMEVARSNEEAGDLPHGTTKLKHCVGEVWKDATLAYHTLGVVFGGLVTSPLYVYSSMELPSTVEKDDLLSVFSVMFWTLTIVGVVKYACIAINANDNGEGGTFALYSLLCKHLNISLLPSRVSNPPSTPESMLNSSMATTRSKPSKLGQLVEGSVFLKWSLLLVSMLAMCMLIGDGVLTPAISVLSAIDGLRGPFPAVNKSIVEVLSATVLSALFLIQKHGTSRVSFLFSPVIAAWTISTPAIGVYNVWQHYPGVFRAVSPVYVTVFIHRSGRSIWRLLGGTVLCITGVEAMFADLGHFNKRSIQMAFVLFIYPSLVLTYAGQTAYLIRNAGDCADAFYRSVPAPLYWPMLAVATMASIVASQSLISAAFSVVKQAVALDYLPRVRIEHTSDINEGEVYSPEANYGLLFLCVGVVIGFGDGRAIGNCYGIVVILVMFITTILLTLVILIVWRAPLPLAALFFSSFAFVEGVYVAAVMTKFADGGYLPFTISLILSFIMFAWYSGRRRKADFEAARRVTASRLADLLAMPDLRRVPGVCFFYTKPTRDRSLDPVVGHYALNVRSLHSIAVLVSACRVPAARAAPGQRVAVGRVDVSQGVYRCDLRLGYRESIDAELVMEVMSALRELASALPEERGVMDAACWSPVVHIVGKTRLRAGADVGRVKRLLIGFYELLHGACEPALPELAVPAEEVMEVGVIYRVESK